MWGVSVFNENQSNHMTAKMFLDGQVNVARYETTHYSIFDKLTERQSGFFWRPNKIDMTKDIGDFQNLSDAEKHIFTSNLQRQILLDSIQGRGPSLALLPIASTPEVEVWVQTWAYFETIHSRSYTHVIRSVYPVAMQKLFDDITLNPEIIGCAKDISKYYDTLIELNAKLTLGLDVDPYEHKKALWLCINAINALEGIRFYVSFACSWAFAEMGVMQGNATIIQEIARDENVHLASTQHMLKILVEDDPDFAKLSEECSMEVYQMFNDVIEQEKRWADFLFQKGSMIGLTTQILHKYVDFIASKRMRAIGLYHYAAMDTKSNPLPWTEARISGGSIQVAPQEKEITSYLTDVLVTEGLDLAGISI